MIAQFDDVAQQDDTTEHATPSHSHEMTQDTATSAGKNFCWGI